MGGLLTPPFRLFLMREMLRRYGFVLVPLRTVMNGFTLYGPTFEEEGMGELAPRDYYPPEPVRRSTAKQIAQIQQKALINRAAIAAAEQNEAYKGELRTNNVYNLATLASYRATGLRDLVSQVGRGDPVLELILRGFEETAALGARTVIHQYMTRP